MRKRSKINYKKSKKSFSKNAVRVRPQNSWNPMRGGIRL